MEQFGWSWDELMDIPYEVYLDLTRIKSLEAKKKKQEQEKTQKKYT